jgi:hypothetical protein
VDIRAGDRVSVNVAPFIGSARRNKDSVPCEVLEVAGTRMRVATEPPYCKVELWVKTAWIDERLGEAQPLSEPSLT